MTADRRDDSTPPATRRWRTSSGDGAGTGLGAGATCGTTAAAGGAGGGGAVVDVEVGADCANAPSGAEAHARTPRTTRPVGRTFWTELMRRDLHVPSPRPSRPAEGLWRSPAPVAVEAQRHDGDANAHASWGSFGRLRCGSRSGFRVLTDGEIGGPVEEALSVQASAKG